MLHEKEVVYGVLASNVAQVEIERMAIATVAFDLYLEQGAAGQEAVRRKEVQKERKKDQALADRCHRD